ncbi:hypothetical protein [Clostridium chromiireducens]|uniref:hypothetical protein n=1 Tax=Clostridium chromiireducens TaxID=225345 RepID=UPI0015F91272|nr:hypothetical protein [Clostridium chromiireducens]
MKIKITYSQDIPRKIHTNKKSSYAAIKNLNKKSSYAAIKNLNKKAAMLQLRT